MKKPKVDWCFLNYEKQPPVLTCGRCGEEQVLPLPMDLSKVVDRLKGFEIQHQKCQPK